MGGKTKKIYKNHVECETKPVSFAYHFHSDSNQEWMHVFSLIRANDIILIA